MWTNPKFYDVIIIGAGHAGCEAAHAAARTGAKTLLLTMNVDTLAKMSCNPSIGGTAKGHIVREIDALGGVMGKLADQTGIHFRMLNASRGPSVRSPRAQVDKLAYSFEMKHLLEKTENLFIHQAMATSLVIENDQIKGVITREGVCFQTRCVILSSGTFLRGTIHIGHLQFSGGRSSDPAADELSCSLEQIGFRLGRLKTGTPPRIHRRSIDFTKTEVQEGEEGVFFSYDAKERELPQVPCYITYTTPLTKEVILRDLKKSALFGGKIKGVGPRYCPSIEDKMVRFADKERHQIFLEPEGIHTEEFYVNGLSSSMPQETQKEVIQSICGLENAGLELDAFYEAAGDEGADGGVCAGHRKYRHTSRDGRCGDLASGIGDAGRARVADDGDARARPERCGEFNGAGGLVVLVVADGGRADTEVVEQLLRLARVLAGDAVDRAQDAQGAQGDVLQIADGRGDEVEARSEGLAILIGNHALALSFETAN